MGSEDEASSTTKLQLFSVPPMVSPEPSGMLTPPLETSASVPFIWEEEPGKPRPCTALITLPIPTNKSLELPPRLQLQQMHCSNAITKMPSPTTVFDGPYVGKTVFSSSSFRLISSKRHDSFNSRTSERLQIGAVLLDKRSGHKGRGHFGSWGQKTKTLKLKGGQSDGGEGSFVFSSSMDEEACDESGDGRQVKVAKFRRNGSLSSLSHPKSHFWTTMYEGLKHVIPWSRKSKKQVLIN